jgi:hypothetical protein
MVECRITTIGRGSLLRRAAPVMYAMVIVMKATLVRSARAVAFFACC